MAKTRNHAPPLVAVLLVLALAAPANAQTSERDQERRAAASAKRVQAASELDTLRASDDTLETTVRSLDAGISTQASVTEAAEQAAYAAETALSAAEARLAATEKRVADLRLKASALAVRSYVNPSGTSFLEIMRARDLSEASRRQTLLAHVVSSDRDVLGQLRAARQDQQAEQDNLAVLRDRAQERKEAAAERLASLQKARAEQVRLRNALDVRIREYTAEVDALAREEASLSALIRERDLDVAVGGGSGKVSGAGLVWPIAGSVTSGFGLRWGRMHSGIDIAAGYGAPIRAAKGGTVILAGSNGGYGLTVVLDHGGGLSTLYAHQSRMVVGDGERVSQGEVVGYVGTSGNSTGAHLHFETRVGGSAQNPMNFLD